MTVEAWLAAAQQDAERRGLGELIPLLQTLAASTMRLRRQADRQLESAGETSPGERA